MCITRRQRYELYVPRAPHASRHAWIDRCVTRLPGLCRRGQRCRLCNVASDRGDHMVAVPLYLPSLLARESLRLACFSSPPLSFLRHPASYNPFSRPPRGIRIYLSRFAVLLCRGEGSLRTMRWLRFVRSAYLTHLTLQCAIPFLAHLKGAYGIFGVIILYGVYNISI